jgi:hypothetical protein
MLRLVYLYPSRDSAGRAIAQKRYLTLTQSEMRGGFRTGDNFTDVKNANPAWRFADGRYNSRDPKRGLVIVDAWGRPLYYDCHTIDPDPRYPTRSKKAVSRTRMTIGSDTVYPAVHNAAGCDIFSCGADGRTTPNNKLDDNQDGKVDKEDDMEYSDTTNNSALSGSAADDINNWGDN